MRVVLQRVSRAQVRVAKRVVGEVGRGLLLLVGFTNSDTVEDLTWMADKLVGLRVFSDADGKMNLSVADVGGGALVVSQFTLYGDTDKGRRPSFLKAAPPEVSQPLYQAFVDLMEERLPGRVGTGEFGAAMDVELVGDGPVTLLLDRP